ncbi:MAG: hypothetical protein CVT99_12330 [Bacteroidetes bacterium HGW-Bacteroidetes-16]|nr:MAG: hypothetical protein CVT99_12330 [Bacteroidetes bacterium HGW-Bacteroidetes-16]
MFFGKKNSIFLIVTFQKSDDQLLQSQFKKNYKQSLLTDFRFKKTKKIPEFLKMVIDISLQIHYIW